MNYNANLAVDSLVQQLARTAKENAINYALAVELQAKVTELEKEIEKLKGHAKK